MHSFFSSLSVSTPNIELELTTLDEDSMLSQLNQPRAPKTVTFDDCIIFYCGHVLIFNNKIPYFLNILWCFHLI